MGAAGLLVTVGILERARRNLEEPSSDDSASASPSSAPTSGSSPSPGSVPAPTSSAASVADTDLASVSTTASTSASVSTSVLQLARRASTRAITLGDKNFAEKLTKATDQDLSTLVTDLNDIFTRYNNVVKNKENVTRFNGARQVHRGTQRTLESLVGLNRSALGGNREKALNKMDSLNHMIGTELARRLAVELDDYSFALSDDQTVQGLHHSWKAYEKLEGDLKNPEFSIKDSRRKNTPAVTLQSAEVRRGDDGNITAVTLKPMTPDDKKRLDKIDPSSKDEIWV